MIELTWGAIRDTEFHQAIKEMFHSKLDFLVSKQVIQIIRSIDREKEIASPIWDKHIAEYYVIDGNQFKLKDSSEKFVKREAEDVQKIASQKFKIKVPKLKIEDLKNVKITPNELNKLSPLIEMVEGPTKEPSTAKNKKK